MKFILIVTTLSSLGIGSLKADEPLTCHEHPGAFVIERAVRDGLGTDIIVKRRDKAGPKMACEYIVAEDDFEFKNEMSEYFIDLQGRFLILDSGTGPDRGLEIWDIEAKKRTYAIQYSEPLSIRAEAIEFWTETGEGTSSNCPLY